MSPDLARELLARQNTDGSWASLPRPMQRGAVDGELPAPCPCLPPLTLTAPSPLPAHIPLLTALTLTAPQPRPLGFCAGESLASPAAAEGEGPEAARAAELRTRVAVAVLETWVPPQWGVRVDMPLLLAYGWLHRLEQRQLTAGVR